MSGTDEDRVAIPGSARASPGTSRRLRPAGPGEPVEATLVVRRPERPEGMAAALLAGQPVARSREEAEERLRSSDADVQSVVEFASRFGLRVVRTSREEHVVQVEGTVSQAEAAFGVVLAHVEEGGRTFRSYDGEITVPRSMAGVITAVLGLDERPVARRRGG